MNSVDACAVDGIKQVISSHARKMTETCGRRRYTSVSCGNRSKIQRTALPFAKFVFDILNIQYPRRPPCLSIDAGQICKCPATSAQATVCRHVARQDVGYWRLHVRHVSECFAEVMASVRSAGIVVAHAAACPTFR